jgi:hypothetical protein
MSEDNYAGLIPSFVEHLESVDYPRLNCTEKSCTWQRYCQNTKWYWQGDAKNSRSTKLRDYCRFKQIVSNSYYQALIKPSHEPTSFRIKTQKEFLLVKSG